MKSDSRDIQDDKFAAIGIGAMIVFIALILVAAVAAAVIIQTAEKLQQNAQTTGEDTSKNLAGKLIVNAGFVATGADGGPGWASPEDAYTFYVRFAPGSTPVMVNQITFQLMCDSGIAEGTFSNVAPAAISMLNDGATLMNPTEELQPAQPYVFWLNADNGGGDCSPDNGDTSVQLYIHVGTGGTTYEVLNIGSTAAGAEVI
jgi:archaellin